MIWSSARHQCVCRVTFHFFCTTFLVDLFSKWTFHVHCKEEQKERRRPFDKVVACFEYPGTERFKYPVNVHEAMAIGCCGPEKEWKTDLGLPSC